MKKILFFCILFWCLACGSNLALRLITQRATYLITATSKKKSPKKICFHSVFRGLNQNFMLNKPTYFLLDHGMLFYGITSSSVYWDRKQSFDRSNMSVFMNNVQINIFVFQSFQKTKRIVFSVLSLNAVSSYYMLSFQDSICRLLRKNLHMLHTHVVWSSRSPLSYECIATHDSVDTRDEQWVFRTMNRFSLYL